MTGQHRINITHDCAVTVRGTVLVTGLLSAFVTVSSAVLARDMPTMHCTPLVPIYSNN